MNEIIRRANDFKKKILFAFYLQESVIFFNNKDSVSLIITQGSNYHIINRFYIYIYLCKDLIGVESTWNEIKKAVKSTPTMVFSVIGDSENFVSKPWQTTVFQTALIEAARSGGGISFYDF